MSGITHITIQADILRLPLSDKAKMLLGLIHSFNSHGLMMGNAELAKLLCTSPKHITRLLAEIRNHTRVENGQSRFRKIYHSRKNAEVENTLLPQNCVSKETLLPHTGDLLPHIGELLPQNCGHTPALMRSINKRTETIEKKKRERGHFTPPTIEEIRQYIADHPEYSNVDAEMFFKYFSEGNPPWTDSKGNPVKSWKQKLITWSNHNDRSTATRGHFVAGPGAIQTWK